MGEQKESTQASIKHSSYRQTSTYVHSQKRKEKYSNTHINTHTKLERNRFQSKMTGIPPPHFLCYETIERSEKYWGEA